MSINLFRADVLLVKNILNLRCSFNLVKKTYQRLGVQALCLSLTPSIEGVFHGTFRLLGSRHLDMIECRCNEVSENVDLQRRVQNARKSAELCPALFFLQDNRTCCLCLFSKQHHCGGLGHRNCGESALLTAQAVAAASLASWDVGAWQQMLRGPARNQGACPLEGHRRRRHALVQRNPTTHCRCVAVEAVTAAQKAHRPSQSSLWVLTTWMPRRRQLCRCLWRSSIALF